MSTMALAAAAAEVANKHKTHLSTQKLLEAFGTYVLKAFFLYLDHVHSCDSIFITYA